MKQPQRGDQRRVLGIPTESWSAPFLKNKKVREWRFVRKGSVNLILAFQLKLRNLESAVKNNRNFAGLNNPNLIEPSISL